MPVSADPADEARCCPRCWSWCWRSSPSWSSPTSTPTGSGTSPSGSRTSTRPGCAPRSSCSSIFGHPHRWRRRPQRVARLSVSSAVPRTVCASSRASSAIACRSSRTAASSRRSSASSSDSWPASSASAQWRSWLMFRNGVPFGSKDPQFHMDVSFFAFRLPFWRYLLGFGFAVVLLSLIVAARRALPLRRAAAQTPGERLDPGRPGPPVRAARRLRAAQGGRPTGSTGTRSCSSSTSWRQHGVVDHGCHYTDVNAVLPAKNDPARRRADLRRAVLRQRVAQDLALPALGLGLLVLSASSSAASTRDRAAFQVRPNEPSKEAPYIQRNIDATRPRTTLDGAVSRASSTPSTTSTHEGRGRGTTPIDAERPAARPGRRQPDVPAAQQIRAFYNFPDPLDVDRYTRPARQRLRGRGPRARTRRPHRPRQQQLDQPAHASTPTATASSPRRQRRMPTAAPSFFEQRHARRRASIDDQPAADLLRRGLAARTRSSAAPNGSEPREFDYDDAASGGPGQLHVRRARAASTSGRRSATGCCTRMKFQERNFLLSDRVNANSKILYVRDPRGAGREGGAVPDPRRRPVPGRGRRPDRVDPRRLHDVATATRTRSAHDPGRRDDRLARPHRQQRRCSARQDINYIRNSVKATVDAYDGTVTLYEFDEQDPVLKTWKKAFRGTVQPQVDDPADLVAHFRYPRGPVQGAAGPAREATTSPTRSRSTAARTSGRCRTTRRRATAAARRSRRTTCRCSCPGRATPVFQLTTTLTAAAAGQPGRVHRGRRRPGHGLRHDPGAGAAAEPQIPGPARCRTSSTPTRGRRSSSRCSTAQGSDRSVRQPADPAVGGGLLYVEPLYVEPVYVHGRGSRRSRCCRGAGRLRRQGGVRTTRCTRRWTRCSARTAPAPARRQRRRPTPPAAGRRGAAPAAQRRPAAQTPERHHGGRAARQATSRHGEALTDVKAAIDRAVADGAPTPADASPSPSASPLQARRAPSGAGRRGGRRGRGRGSTRGGRRLPCSPPRWR